MLILIVIEIIAALIFIALTYRLRWLRAESRARRYRSRNNDMIDYISLPSNIWWP